jgi:hypothetical protein
MTAMKMIYGFSGHIFLLPLLNMENWKTINTLLLANWQSCELAVVFKTVQSPEWILL